MVDESKSEKRRGTETEEILGKPVFDEFPENTLRIRRNLLLVGFLVLAYKLNELTVSSEISAVGLKFEGLTNYGVDLTMFCLVSYHLIHFFWNSLTHLQQWRLRVTGTVLAHQTGSMAASELKDYPDDPRQSTLYTWWSQQAQQFGNIGRDAQELKSKMATWEEQVKALSDPTATANMTTVMRSLSEIQRTAADLKREVEAATKVLSSDRIPVSLIRYDRWFMSFQWNQVVRWFAIELLMPIAIGVWACWLSWPFS